MQVQPVRYQGLIADLMPNIRLMQASGHFLFRYTSGPVLIRKLYSAVHLILIFCQFFAILVNMAFNADEVNELTANTITVLFFTHSITKFIYFALNSSNFYKWVNFSSVCDCVLFVKMSWIWILINSFI